jgi:hypothetical protein
MLLEYQVPLVAHLWSNYAVSQLNNDGLGHIWRGRLSSWRRSSWRRELLVRFQLWRLF